jgi:peptide/nickel transport system permease protein
MAMSREKTSWTIKRLINFLSVFKRNRRGMLGVIILIAFALMSLGAEVIVPTSPTQDYVSADYSIPVWFKYISPSLIYSENFYMLETSGFPTLESFNEWTVTKSRTSTAQVSVDYDPAPGSGGDPGSIVITFSRPPGSYRGDVAEIHFTKQFEFPYSGSPRIFEAMLAWLPLDISHLQQVELALFLHRIETNGSQTSYAIWVKQLYESEPTWIMPMPAVSSYDPELKTRVGNITQEAASVIFKPKQQYIYDLRVKMTDSNVPGRIQATLNLDDFNMKFYGTAYGLLGTDHRGRDIFAQLVYGSRISLFVGLLSAFLSVVIGLAVGLVAGYLGKIVDELTMRLTDMLLVLPGLPLLIVLIAVLGPSIFNLVLLIGVLGWMGFARVVRSMVLSLKERPFVEAAKAVGAGKFHIIIKHVLPNVMSLVYVTLALSVPGAILSEAALSWLGLFDPTVVSWGRMLNEAQFNQGIDKPWWIVPPGIAICLVSLSFVLLGYALDEMLNPKLRQRR